MRTPKEIDSQFFLCRLRFFYYGINNIKMINFGIMKLVASLLVPWWSIDRIVRGPNKIRYEYGKMIKYEKCARRSGSIKLDRHEISSPAARGGP